MVYCSWFPVVSSITAVIDGTISAPINFFIHILPSGLVLIVPHKKSEPDKPESSCFIYSGRYIWSPPLLWTDFQWPETCWAYQKRLCNMGHVWDNKQDGCSWSFLLKLLSHQYWMNWTVYSRLKKNNQLHCFCNSKEEWCVCHALDRIWQKFNVATRKMLSSSVQAVVCFLFPVTLLWMAIYTGQTWSRVAHFSVKCW